ncbi:MAG: 4Fe-4S cluster-binding domain-containing protein [Chloroflexi bacterium]|nr:4Fe-4S cluster-binding domain-containing protein [Chloroflexota bacterium]
MERLYIPEPYSAGILLTYKCTSACKHCLYACSPQWKADFLSLGDAERILSQLAERMRGKYPFPERIGVNDGIHFTGGEPFMNFERLLQVVRIAAELDMPSRFVETNAAWCIDDEVTRGKLLALREAGLHGILISANPFTLEYVPFERTERAARIAREVFPPYNVIVYQELFYEQFRQLGLKGTLGFGEYLRGAGYVLRYMELFASGRAAYALAHLFPHHPAERFFGVSCRDDLIREWHIHVDNYGNFMPGFCGGLSLGDARELDALCRDGVDLDERPVLRALLTDLRDLYELGRRFGYEEREEGYVSKCHLCLDIRRHLVQQGDFQELQPQAFYEHLEAGTG